MIDLLIDIMAPGSAKGSLDERAFEINSINMPVAYASLNISLLQDPHVCSTEDNRLSAAVTGKKGRLEEEVIVDV